MDSDEYMDEEDRIAHEQDAEETVLTAEVFKRKIRSLDLPKPLCVSADTTLIEVVKKMKARKVGSLLVVTDKGKVEGIFTERDLLNRVLGVVDDLNSAKVVDYMTPNPNTLLKDDMICFALHDMHMGVYRNIPILNEDGTPYAMLNIQSFLDFILDYFPQEITNILSEPFRGERQAESA
ncbi:hypothetical protein A9Q84_17170 [Halobacteriovorax marinus]|uniref:CBS domain-containing protein n=1 Tax=Halobacteriovorax marinus TaxID=97084 RepID=A0A1Y5F3X9_9BACT|nr:hypothetical protein A9Q84_17170 [Halobacteriovorax marinus]